MILTGSGLFILPLIFIFSDLLSFADYNLAGLFSGLGIFLYLLSLLILWRSHADLGQNRTPELEIREKQKLIVRGIYRFIRHPMYAAHFLWESPSHF